MRTFYFILLLKFAATAGQPAVGQPCRPQYPFYDSTAFLNTARYLARAVAMNGLTDENLPMGVDWNRTPDGRRCYTGGPPADPASYVDSLTCNGRCTFAYCPVNFAADVALLVQLRASFVQFAAANWDRAERFVPGSDFLKAAAQTVIRINEAYDCVGLPRPFIQASVLENVDESRTCDPPATPCESWMKPGPPGTNSGVRDVAILPSVIEEFRNELHNPADSAYYLDENGHPRTKLHFSFPRLSYLFWRADYAPDATKLEGRMWLYYQATCYLDCGYTSLHMGQPKVWAKLHLVPAAQMPAALHRMGLFLARIRHYARQRPGNLPLLLTAEPMTLYGSNDREIQHFVDGRDALGRPRLLFDFGMATMRPRETYPALDEAANPVPNAFSCPDLDPLALTDGPCAGRPMATIDPCHGYNFGPDGGGVTPLGAQYKQSPYVIYFDHGDSVAPLPGGGLATTGVLWPGNGSVWGWDDSAWFSKALGDSCQARWLTYQMRRVQAFSNSRGFLAAPGRVTNNLYTGYNQGPGRPDQPELSVADYRLAAHPVVVAALAQAWQPTVPSPVVSVDAGEGIRQGQCPNSWLFHRRYRQLPAWTLRVSNPDPTSLYAWHLANGTGPDTVLYGTTQRFLPATAGSYSVVLYQHNLGLPPENRGVRRVPVLAASAVAICVSRKQARHGRRATADAKPAIP